MSEDNRRPQQRLKLKLVIKFGNAGMMTMHDMRVALIQTTNALRQFGDDEPHTSYKGEIRDSNGQKVGAWRFVRRRKGEKE